MKNRPQIPFYGFFNVNKPSGITSSTVVNKLKWLTGVPCGHMGTLDPLADGVLPVGVGNATRLFDYFLDKDKEYVAEFTFGVDSDTLDSTGALVYGGRIPTEQEIVAVLPKFQGELLQVPPRYSAKNVNGKRGYDLARAGVEFELPPKQVRVDGVELLGKAEGKADTFLFKIRCGGGTYIRSIARDIAAELNTKAVMSALRRTQSGVFRLETAIDFAELEKDPDMSWLTERLIPTQSVLSFPDLRLPQSAMDKLFHGMTVPLKPLSLEQSVADGTYKIYQQDGFYGLAEVKDGKAKAKTKLC